MCIDFQVELGNGEKLVTIVVRKFLHLQFGCLAVIQLRQHIQPTTLVGGEPVGQPTLDLATRLIAGLDAEPLERTGQWDDDPAPPALLSTTSPARWVCGKAVMFAIAGLLIVHRFVFPHVSDETAAS